MPQEQEQNGAKLAKAYARIEEVRKSNGTHLDLSETGITDLTSVARLTALQTLDLKDCKGLSDLSPLAKLTSLQSLDLRRSEQLTDLTPLAGLNSLKELFIMGSQLTDLAPLGKIVSLRSLFLSGKQLSDLTPLANLTSLQMLLIAEVPLGDISPLAGLNSLQKLSLAFCKQLTDLTPLRNLVSLDYLSLFLCEQLTDLAPLTGLDSLKTLGLSECRELTNLAPLAELASLQGLGLNWCSHLTDITPLKRLRRLRTLNMWGTQVRCLPHWILSHTCLEEVVINSLEDVPKDVQSNVSLTDNCLLRLRAWWRDREFGEVREPEAKVFVLGNGGVGKTQLVRHLSGFNFDPSVPTTHGVKLTSLAANTEPLRADAQINIWDFGGQEIYYGTHALFLKSHGVFLILWNPELERTDFCDEGGSECPLHPLAYWRDYIWHATGTESPVIVVQSKCENRSDARGVSPELLVTGARSLAFSARTGYGRESLIGAMRDALRELSHEHSAPPVGSGWVAVRDELRRRISEERVRTLSRKEFDVICAEKGGVSEPAVLLDYLHRTGVVFHCEDLFRGVIILDQNWALNAIYTLFDRDRCLPWLLADGTGTFTRTDLGSYVWDRAGFSSDEQELFLSMMESCGICFKWQKKASAETIWLAPELLPARDAEAVREQLEGRLRASDLPQRRIVFRYRCLHEGIVRALLIKIGNVAKDAAVYWRTGVWLYERKSGAYAMVNAVYRATESAPGCGQIEVSVYGDRSNDFASMLRDEIEKLGMPEAEVIDSQPSEPYLSMPDAPDFPADFLETAQFASPAPVPRGATPAVFISYAWGDETPLGKQRTVVVEGLCQKLDAEGLTVSIDKRKIRNGESIAAFLKQFGSADHVIAIIGDKYVTSPYCMFELLSVWQTSGNDPENFQRRVHPLILEDGNIGTTEGRAKTALFWKHRYQELLDMQKELGEDMGEAAFRELRLTAKFKAEVADMLFWLNDVLMPRGFDKIEADDYCAILEVLRRR